MLGGVHCLALLSWTAAGVASAASCPPGLVFAEGVGCSEQCILQLTIPLPSAPPPPLPRATHPHAGVEPELRREAWKWLLGVWPAASSAAQRAALAEEQGRRYAALKRQWQSIGDDQVGAAGGRWKGGQGGGQG